MKPTLTDPVLIGELS